MVGTSRLDSGHGVRINQDAQLEPALLGELHRSIPVRLVPYHLCGRSSACSLHEAVRQLPLPGPIQGRISPVEDARGPAAKAKQLCVSQQISAIISRRTDED